MSSTQQLLLGEGAGGAIPNYIEEVFSTQVYTGAGTSKIITNNIDLSTKGGLVWTKMRTSPVVFNQHNHRLSDSAIGVNQVLSSNNADPKTSSASFGISSFNVDGYTITNPGGDGGWNYTGDTFVSWTFRKQKKFFDVLTYTGDGNAGRAIAHNLGSVPGFIVVKSTSASSQWICYHRSITADYEILLNLTNASAVSSKWNNQTPTSTDFYVSGSAAVNGSGATYVAYLFAHDAGGFGLTGTDNVISCGSFTSDGSGNATVTLGYEPQWILYKPSSSVGNWEIADTMRGWNNANIVRLYPDDAAPEGGYTANTPNAPTATGFTFKGLLNFSSTYIYIAVRRGPMKVPTVGTTVFNSILRTGTGAAATVSTGNLPDWVIIKQNVDGSSVNAYSRLQGPNRQFYGELSLQEINQGAGYGVTSFLNTSFTLGLDANGENQNGRALINWTFSRAPSFFDQVCYKGVGGTASFSHNLGVAPELIFVKCRSNGNGGLVYNKTITASKYLCLFFSGQGDFAEVSDVGGFAGVTPTSSVFTVGTYTNVNGSGLTYVAWLFATCAGVSKVGSYTGNGTTQTIDCGFGANGARFVVIKRTDAVGDWYTYDTTRGMTVLTDPYTFLNTTNAQVATLGSVTTVTTGFALNSAILAAINVSAGSYIFLAIA